MKPPRNRGFFYVQNFGSWKKFLSRNSLFRMSYTNDLHQFLSLELLFRMIVIHGGMKKIWWLTLCFAFVIRDVRLHHLGFPSGTKLFRTRGGVVIHMRHKKKSESSSTGFVIHTMRYKKKFSSSSRKKNVLIWKIYLYKWNIIRTFVIH
jgi:hypothetical protein